MKEGYIPKEQRKKILLIGDDIRMTSGVAGILREIVIGTAHHYNWAQIGGVIKHPEEGKRLDLSNDTNIHAEIPDSQVIMYPMSGYGDPDTLRSIIKIEQPDAIMMMTDPRYFIWLFNMEHELRQQLPIIYLNIWDNLPYPRYNKSYYNSCDGLLAISKQTENINTVVLEEVAKDKVIKYVPHGINEKHFEPISETDTNFINFKKHVLGGKEYNFVVLYNARNIGRKCVPDLMLSYKLFIDKLGINEAKKCALLLHTQPLDENGTDLNAVKEMLFGDDPRYNIIFSEEKLAPVAMKYLYALADVTTLISSNEGWGLSLTESMMCGKMIIGNVTGGMQDQMRFEDEKGAWIKFDEKFGSNHRAKSVRCGEWALPVFPSTISILGSIPTPYIFDDRVRPEDVSYRIKQCYDMSPEERKRRGLKGREWVQSDESMMSARWMIKNTIVGIDETLEKFKPRRKYDLVKVGETKLKHYNRYVISQ